MSFKERKERYALIAQNVDGLNTMEGAYCEDDKEFLYEQTAWIARTPSLWENKQWSRITCYSAFSSKLLLAYLLSEIKEGNLLDCGFLESIKNATCDSYDLFFYDDIGYETANVLERIVVAVMSRNGYFKLETRPVILDFSDQEYENEAEFSELVYDKLTDECPELMDFVEREDAEKRFWMTSYYAPYISRYELKIHFIRSEILYRIKELEKKYPTELGKGIIQECNDIFVSLFQADTFGDEIRFVKNDDKGREIVFMDSTAPIIFGSDLFYRGHFWDLERHHIYNYSFLFRLDDLIRKIEEYECVIAKRTQAGI